MRTATSHGSRPVANAAIRSDASGSSEVTTTAGAPNPGAAASAMPRAWSWSMAITRPPASGWWRRTSARRSTASRSTVGSHSPSSDSAVRRRWLASWFASGSSKVASCTAPSGRAPLHLAADPREVDRPHHAAVAQRVAVAVLVVGDGLVRPRSGRTGWRACRSGTACPRGDRRRRALAERLADGVAPGLLVARVVDLVEDDVGAAGQRAQLRRAHRHLLVGGDDAVHVRRQPAVGRATRPGPGGGRSRAAAAAHWTLRWAVGATIDDPGRPLREGGAQGGQRERRLAGAGRGDGEEVRVGGGREPRERGVLPGAETDAAGHATSAWEIACRPGRARRDLPDVNDRGLGAGAGSPVSHRRTSQACVPYRSLPQWADLNVSSSDNVWLPTHA